MSNSLWRYVKNVQAMGFKQYIRAMWYIGDAKHGKLMGEDQFGNKYYENLNPEQETPGRQRWIDFTQHDFNASQVPPEWHAWLNHIRKDPPSSDFHLIQASRPKWIGPWRENLTGTRGAFKTYSTTKPKFFPWEPKVGQRGGPSASA
ncbi:NDUFA12-domain-containing protein [Calocera cornea HHB12733]|uniref:NADH dehydrogenase [ubiquinone] 1 alpha subcomplex subunit n=1 Tax=Calocera cornea HHB12733 TaxID=1353952 RepID=A0A165EBQ5_9BASI|nr:NDUFA12-domain-containing protein [Calocera cornea HHB12733]